MAESPPALGLVASLLVFLAAGVGTSNMLWEYSHALPVTDTDTADGIVSLETTRTLWDSVTDADAQDPVVAQCAGRSL